MRMTASWFRSSRIDRIQGCARSSRLMASSPRNCRRLHCSKAHPTNVACRRARDRQGRVASRWPSAILDRHCARRPTTARSGRGDGATWSDECLELRNSCFGGVQLMRKLLRRVERMLVIGFGEVRRVVQNAQDRLSRSIDLIAGGVFESRCEWYDSVRFRIGTIGLSTHRPPSPAVLRSSVCCIP